MPELNGGFGFTWLAVACHVHVLIQKKKAHSRSREKLPADLISKYSLPLFMCFLCAYVYDAINLCAFFSSFI